LAKIFEDAKVENGHSHRFRDTFCVLITPGRRIDPRCLCFVGTWLDQNYREALLTVGEVEAGRARRFSGNGCVYQAVDSILRNLGPFVKERFESLFL